MGYLLFHETSYTKFLIWEKNQVINYKTTGTDTYRCSSSVLNAYSSFSTVNYFCNKWNFKDKSIEGKI